MLRRASLICVLALAACGGGAPTVTAPPLAPTGTLFVANADGISVFPVTASGNAAPQRQITGLSAHTDGAGGGNTTGFSSTTVRGLAPGSTAGSVAALIVSVAHMQSPGSRIFEFSPTAIRPADARIIILLSGIDFGLNPAVGIASVPSRPGYDVLPGLFYVAKTDPPSAFRIASPSRAIAADAAGNVYVSSDNPAQVAVYSPAATTGNATPARTIATASSPGPMAIGPDGTLYVVERANGFQVPSTIEEFAPGASSPARVLGPFPADMSVVSIAVDNQNELYVAQAQVDANQVTTGPGTIAVFAPGASDAATPVRSLQNPIQNMVSIAIGP